MLSFESDYITGAHPEILKRLAETNMEFLSGYGHDPYTESAKEKISKAMGIDTAEITFLVGGTQTNSIVISAMLEDYEGVVSATTGHVAVHEAGAVEYTGNKVLEVPAKDGKIIIPELSKYLENFFADGNAEHMVFPGMVYISHPTEYGTLYTKDELTSLSEICKKYDMPLFLDGARLGYGLAGENTDVTLHDIATLTDVFYIGGTKVGALCGEAVVFTHNNRPKHFENYIKKRGALLAKGRLLSVQFDTLFTDNLYFDISAHAIEMAGKLKAMFAAKGYKFFLESPTNQQFIILENDKLKELEKKVRFSFWEKYDDSHTVVRFATAWSTTDENLKELDSII